MDRGKGFSLSGYHLLYCFRFGTISSINAGEKASGRKREREIREIRVKGGYGETKIVKEVGAERKTGGARRRLLGEEGCRQRKSRETKKSPRANLDDYEDSKAETETSRRSGSQFC